jgi:Tol biopolymer transport system component
MNAMNAGHQRMAIRLTALLAFLLGAAQVGQGQLIKKVTFGDPALALDRLEALGKHRPAVSADGMVVAFESIQTSSEPAGGVYVYDFASGQLDLVGPNGVTPAISADGNVVGWMSRHYNAQIVLLDRSVGMLEEPADVITNHRYISLSADGRYVAYIGGLPDMEVGVVVYDRDTAQFDGFAFENTEELTYDMYAHPSISADGRYVAFSCRRCVPDPPFSFTDCIELVFVWDRDSDDVYLASADSAGVEANGDSSHPFMASDGGFVAFDSTADNLVPGDAGSCRDVFVRYLPAGPTERVSVDSMGDEADRPSYAPAVSADGRYVSFHSWATNLVDDDFNELADVFVRDLQDDQTERVSISSAGGEGNMSSMESAISGDGRYVVFASGADNLSADDANLAWDILRHDCDSGVTEPAAKRYIFTESNGWSEGASISGDGRFVAWSGCSNNHLLADDTGYFDIFLFDTETGITALVTQGHDGSPADGNSFDPVLSGNGRYVAFTSQASNLVPDDLNGYWDAFVYDRLTQEISLVSVNSLGAQVECNSEALDISADGQAVLMLFADGTTRDSGGLYVREAGSTSFVAASGAPADLSGDGRYVAYNWFDDGVTELRVHDRQDGSEYVVYEGWTDSPTLSHEGRYVAFASSDEVVPGAAEGMNIFLHDRELGTYEWMSDFDEPCDDPYLWNCFEPVVSDDGSAVAFTANCYTLYPANNVYVRQRSGDAPQLMSLNRAGEPANGMCESLSISADGRYVAFASEATNLTSYDTNEFPDVFVVDCQGCLGDLNDDGFVNVNDFVLLAWSYGSKYGEPTYLPFSDLDSSGVVNVTDFTLLAGRYGQACP